MTARDRVLAALRHREPDRVPIDFDGMRSTGIMAVAYNRLRAHLGIHAGLPGMYDLGQQLVHPEPEVLARFGVDVRPLNRLPAGLDPEEQVWKPWVLPDGSQALVPAGFNPDRDDAGNMYMLDSTGRRVAKMPAGGLYFDTIHHPLAEAATVSEIEAYPFPDIGDAELAWLRREARRLRESSDAAVMGEFGGNILEACQSLRGWARAMTDLVREPRLAQALMQKLADHAIANLDRYLAAVGDAIDIIQMGDDLGTQQGPQLSPALYRKMVRPHHERIYQHVKKRSGLFVFLHSCGGIAPLIPDLITAGVDALNPVQISAAGMEAAALKREFGRDLTFWGGGCDTQTVLPQASPAEVREHVRRQIEALAPGGGFVFAQVHNVQAGTPPANVMAMFEAALKYGRYG